MRFVLPHHSGLRPWPILRLGLFLYDHLGGRKILPPTSSLNLAQATSPASRSRAKFTRGFEYSDCWVDDARLVVLNARDAADKGAIIKPRTKVSTAAARGRVAGSVSIGGWQRDPAPRRWSIPAGPWVSQVLGRSIGVNAARQDPHGQGQPHRRRQAL